MKSILNKYHYFLGLTILLLCLPNFSYSAKDKPVLKTYIELKELSQKIANKRYSTKINILLYKDNSTKEILESKQMEIYTWDKFLHYKAEDIEAFSNNEMVMTINHRKKLILLNPNLLKNKNASTQALLPFTLDTTIGKIYKIELLKEETSSKTFVFKNQLDGNKINKMLFKIDSKEIKPITCEIYYASNLNTLMGNFKNKSLNKEPKMIFEFTKFDFTTKFIASDFDFSKIIIAEKSNKFRLTDKYKNYELVNNLIKRK